MRNRFCQNFTSGIPVSMDKHMVYNNTQSLNFSAEFWQPFIDLKVSNETAFICGPLLGLVIEISKKLKSNLTYFKTPTGEYSEDFAMMDNRQTNLLLTPFPPISILMTNVSKYSQLSRPIGDFSMISILSSRKAIESLFHLLKIFSLEIWIYFLVSYILISSLSAVMSDSKTFLDYLAIALRQQMKKFDTKHRTASITLIWFWATSVLMWAYSGMLLTFLVFSTPYSKIDSIDEMAQKDINFTVFEGEIALDYMKDTEQPYYQKFLNRCVAEVATNELKEKWEINIFDKISKGIYALVSDQPFLDYYYATKLLNYPNLYRSKSNQLVLPYFMPLSKHNSKQLIHTINQIISYFFESGIYETWIRDTLERNNDALRLGIVEIEDETYDYESLDFKKFKSLFYLIIITFILSFSVFSIESLHFRFKTFPKLFKKI